MKFVQPIAQGLYHIISRHWLLMPLGADTHTHTCVPTRKPKQIQETRCTWPSTVHACLKSLCKGLVLILPRMKKSMALFHIINFLSCYISYLKRKLRHVGHKWVICGSHLDCSVGQMGQQVRPTFNPVNLPTFWFTK